MFAVLEDPYPVIYGYLISINSCYLVQYNYQKLDHTHHTICTKNNRASTVQNNIHQMDFTSTTNTKHQYLYSVIITPPTFYGRRYLIPKDGVIGEIILFHKEGAVEVFLRSYQLIF